jgi:hypothetical protein
MRALTVKQPWAWAILHAGKDIENRGWRTHYKGPLVIHSDDFANETEEISLSFQPYDEQTIVAETAEPSRLYELQHELESAQVVWPGDVTGLSPSSWRHKGDSHEDEF